MLEDGELAQTALRHAVALATDSSTEMLLVHVMPPDLIQVVDVGGYVPGSLCAASAEIQRQSNELIAFGVAVA